MCARDGLRGFDVMLTAGKPGGGVCVRIPVDSFNGSVWTQDKNLQAYALSLWCVV